MGGYNGKGGAPLSQFHLQHPAACYTGLKSPNSQSFGAWFQQSMVQVQELPASTVGNSP